MCTSLYIWNERRVCKVCTSASPYSSFLGLYCGASFFKQKLTTKKPKKQFELLSIRVMKFGVFWLAQIFYRKVLELRPDFRDEFRIRSKCVSLWWGWAKKKIPLCLLTIFHNMRLFVLAQYNKTVWKCQKMSKNVRYYLGLIGHVLVVVVLWRINVRA